MRDCDPDLSDFTVEAAVSNHFDDVQIDRCKTKTGKHIPLVKVIFNSEKDLDAAIGTGIHGGNIICSVENI